MNKDDAIIEINYYPIGPISELNNDFIKSCNLKKMPLRKAPRDKFLKSRGYDQYASKNCIFSYFNGELEIEPHNYIDLKNRFFPIHERLKTVAFLYFKGTKPISVAMNFLTLSREAASLIAEFTEYSDKHLERIISEEEYFKRSDPHALMDELLSTGSMHAPLVWSHGEFLLSAEKSATGRTGTICWLQKGFEFAPRVL